MTTEGKVIGKRVYVGGTKVNRFLGIPYAQPPVAELRFKAPVAPQNRSQTLIATQFSNSCFQVVQSGFPDSERVRPRTALSEDCLYLNIWVPKRWRFWHQRKLATIVHVYGGSFVRGSSSLPLYDGAVLAAYGDVIVVTFNYRLGALGFSYQGTDDIPGNMALWDMRQLLLWLQDNIENFGGDKTKITVMGQSSGGVAASLLMVSPETKDLFNNGMFLSSTFLMPGGVLAPGEALARTTKLADLVNCTDGNGAINVTCLRESHPLTLVELGTEVGPPNFLDLVPVVDGTFFPDNPFDIISSGQAKATGILLGTDKEEFSYFMNEMSPLFNPPLEQKPLIDRNTTLLILSALGPPPLPETILAVYEPLADTPINYWDLIVDVFSDVLFKCSVVGLGQIYSNFGAVYMYEFEHSISVRQTWPEYYGAMHTYELEFVFGDPFRSNGYSYDELFLSYVVMTFWSNFAKYGNPNGPSGSSFWPEYSQANQTYIRLNTTYPFPLGTGLRQTECQFWGSVPI